MSLWEPIEAVAATPERDAVGRPPAELRGPHARTLGTMAARLARGLCRESPAIFVVSLGLDLGAAYYLVFRLNYLAGDALSRVANAFYVLFSRDPHLAAIGLIWNPLPSFLDLPLVALKGWFPWLVNRGFAGNIETAYFGAASAVVIGLLLRDAGVGRALRLGLVAAWAANPMVLLYSANGMSDIILMFFLLLSSLLLLRWLRGPRDILLVGIGVTVATATLVRYEAIPFAFLVLAVIGVAQWRGGARGRELEARLLLYGLPVAFAVLFWVGTNAILMHDPLYFLNGAYGNLSQTQVALGGQQAPMRLESWPAAAGFVALEVARLYPAYPLCALVALALAIRRRQAWAGLAVVLMTTSAFLLMAYLIHRGSLALLLRYFMSAIPFAFVLAAYSLGLVRGRVARAAFGAALFALLAISDAASLGAMSNPGMGLAEHAVVASALRNRALPTDSHLQELRLGPSILRLDPRSRLILIDTFEGGPIILGSPDPRLFVVTSDLDFEAALNDPQAYHVGYFLVPAPVGVGRLDAINRRYPGLWSDGDGFATRVASLGTPLHWRLYRITGPAPQ